MNPEYTRVKWAMYHHESTDTYTIHVAGRSWESWAVAHVGDCSEDYVNAKLIAAAPEMLEALEFAVSTLRWVGECSSPSPDEIEKAINQLEVIINKAKGA